jgi:hypothetical protein
MNDASFPKLHKAAKALTNAILLGVGETPTTDARGCYQSLHRCPLLTCILNEENDSRVLVTLNNQWQGYPDDPQTGAPQQEWRGLEELKAHAPCKIVSVRVVSEGKLPDATCGFTQGDLAFTLSSYKIGTGKTHEVIVAPYAFGDSHYPIEEINIFRAL